MTKPKVAKKGWRVGKKKDESASGVLRRGAETGEKERNADVALKDP